MRLRLSAGRVCHGRSTPVISTAHVQVHIPKWIYFNLWNPAFVLGFLELVLREAAVCAR